MSLLLECVKDKADSMGVTIIRYVSPYTFLMGVLWFSIFVLLSLLMRKLKYPIKLSVMPLVILLILSLARILVPIQLPSGAIIIESEVIFPAIVRFLRYEIIPYTMFGFSVNVLRTLFFLWGTVSFVLLIKYAILWRRVFKLTDKLTHEPDEEAEAILAEISGPQVRGRVFRAPFDTPATSGYKPHIYLPKGVDFTHDELRAILKHEWKHIRSKDYLITYLVHFLCCIFWWNPLVYVLKSNVFFALEVSCDNFVIATSKDLKYFTSALLRIYEKPRQGNMIFTGNAFVSLKNHDADRYELLALRFSDKPRKKRVLAHVCFYLAVGILFLTSYMFLILPATWASDYGHVAIDKPIDCTYSVEAHRAEYPFLVDNSDGTFSLYVDGQHVMDMNPITDDVDQNIFAFLPIITREEWESNED